jgi:hypothetical protein
MREVALPRLTKLKDVCFPVEEHPIFVIVDGPSGKRQLPIPEKKALVNCESGRVLGVVSRDYRLVTNQQALEWARECCNTVFPKTKPAEWDISATDAPSSGGHCRIDLVHRSATLDFANVRPGKRPKEFGPFIRVTNSYNGLRALAFDIGFYRKVCRNGLIAPDTIIHFTFSHQRRDLGSGIRFDVAHDRLEKLQARLGDYLAAVHNCQVSRIDFEPMLRGVLRLRPPQPLTPNTRDADEWERLQHHLRELSNRYAHELGETAYGVLNAITDFASHPPENRHVHRDRHGLQRLAGAWLSEFSQICQGPNFSLAHYLDKVAVSTTSKTTATTSTSRFVAPNTGESRNEEAIQAKESQEHLALAAQSSLFASEE